MTETASLVQAETVNPRQVPSELGASMLRGAGVTDSQLDPERLLEQRNAFLDATLNAEGSLPVVELRDRFVPDPRVRMSYTPHDYKVLTSGQAVGFIRINEQKSASSKRPAVVTGVELEKGQGYGKASYLAALKSLPIGMQLACDNSVSEDAIKIWQWLENADLAKRATEEPLRAINGKYKDPGYRTTI